MQILKAFFKVASKLKGSIIMNISIFITIGMIISGTVNNTDAVFEQSQLNVVVFDEDGTAESKALYDFVADNHKIVEMENDPEKLWDNLYYHNINYVLTIEKGYAEKLRNGETDNLFTYSVDPQSYSCEYLNMHLRQYVSTLDTLMKSGEDFDSAQAETITILKNDTSVTAHDFSEKASSEGVNIRFVVFMRYMAYILPAIMLTVLSRIIIELRSENIKNRTFCSPISPMKYNGQIIAGSIIFSIAIWTLIVTISFMLSGGTALSENVILAIVNSLAFLLISIGIAVLVSMCFSKNSFAIDMIANIVCLGMAFLCGVFVEQSLLGEKVLSVGRFLPAYWYVKAIDSIGQVGGTVFDAGAVWQFIGVEALFAAAFFALSMVVARFKKA